MSDSDNTRPPKFGGRGAFVESRKVHGGPDPERASNKGHPRESWREDREAANRRDRHKDRQALARADPDEDPPPPQPRHSVQWDRW